MLYLSNLLGLQFREFRCRIYLLVHQGLHHRYNNYKEHKVQENGTSSKMIITH